MRASLAVESNAVGVALFELPTLTAWSMGKLITTVSA